MKSTSCSVWLPALAIAWLSTTAAPAGSAERAPVRRGAPAPTLETEARVIVKYKADAALMRAPASPAALLPQHAQALSARLGLSLTDGRVIGARAQVLKARGLSSRDLADRMTAQPDVDYAVVDGRMHALDVPNDPLYPAGQASTTPVVGQWYLRAPTSATIAGPTSVVSAINAQAAWNISTGRASIVVAVLDTGVRLDHPDLAAKLRPGYDFIADTGVSIDGDGRDADPSDPGDFGCTASDTTSSWHGTQTAGLIGAATNNGIGMAGAGRDVMLLPLRVLGKCGGYDSDIQAAMVWAAGLSSTPALNPYPARVVNLSLGSASACSASYRDVIAQLNAAGVVVVAAAGNDGVKVGTPANCAGVIAVAGVRHAGTKVGYSDLGPEIAIAAPAGNCVNNAGPCLYPLLTTSNTGTTAPVVGATGATYTNSGANASLGTSFSAPLVAGTVGLMFSANPALTPAQVRAALQSTARAFPANGAAPVDDGTGTLKPVAACTAPTTVAQNSECYCTTSTCGAGLLDAGAAVASIASVSANIAVASTTAVAGSAITLDGSGSRASSGSAAITGYQWAITAGASIASFTSATNAPTATLVTSGAGSVSVSLTVTDSAGLQSTQSVTINVGAVPAVAPAATGGGGGGGGMLSFGWLLGWLGAVLGVWGATPRRRVR